MSFELSEGDRVADRYRVVRALGAGAAGAVYEVEHEELGRRFALKLLRAEVTGFPGIEERFYREARCAAQLDHPNIVSVTDFGRDERHGLYMVMELAGGHSLARRVAASAIGIAEVLEVADAILAALEHAHGQGVIHRDVKPDNVVVGEKNGVPFVKLVDFGLAKALATPDGEQPLTQSGMVFGTPRYMSPEQATADPVDARADLYSTAAVIYELLAGRPLFTGSTHVEVLSKHVSVAPDPLDLEPTPGIDVRVVEAAVMCALSKSPGDRFGTAAELREALASARRGGGERVLERWRRLSAELAARVTSSNAREGSSLAMVSAGLRTLLPTDRRARIGGGVALALALALGAWSLGSSDGVDAARAALDRGDVDGARAQLTAHLASNPRDARAHLLAGRIAAASGSTKDATASFTRALQLDDVGADAGLAAFVTQTLTRGGREADGICDAVIAHGGSDAWKVLVDIATNAPHPKHRRGAYEALERLDREDELVQLEYLTRELERNGTDTCSIRQWYVERIIELKDPAARAVLTKERDRRGGFLGLERSGDCMASQIAKALADLPQ